MSEENVEVVRQALEALSRRTFAVDVGSISGGWGLDIASPVHKKKCKKHKKKHHSADAAKKKKCKKKKHH